jgi:hypothetical protein
MVGGEFELRVDITVDAEGASLWQLVAVERWRQDPELGKVEPPPEDRREVVVAEARFGRLGGMNADRFQVLFARAIAWPED